ncbi:MAG: hypothetical protein ACR2Q4_05240 [Geminicoccaceae bacterium]
MISDRKHLSSWFTGLVLALGMTSVCGTASAVDLEIGKTYQGGTLIEAKAFGLGFTVPEGWSGMLPPGGTFFAMTPDNKTFVFATAEPGSIRDAQGSLGQPLPLGNGITLQPIGTPRAKNEGFSIAYNVLGAPEPFGSEGRAVVSETGIIAGFIGVAPQGEVESMLTVLDEISTGVIFEELPEGGN